MLKNGVLGIVFLTGTFTVVAQSGPASAAASQPTMAPGRAASYGKLPLSFEANRGQSDPRVKFTSRGNGYTLFLTGSEAVLALSKEDGKSGVERSALPQPEPGRAPAMNLLKTDVVRMQLSGAKPGIRVIGEEQLPGTANYFIGNDPAKWHASVPTYAKVKYSGVYPGVDLVYYGNQRQLEYDFVVAPGVDAKQVKLHFVGAKLSLNAHGDLMVAGKNGEIAFHKPVVYQVKGGEQISKSPSDREPVNGSFALLADDTVRFDLGSYDKSRAVVIDPTLSYSTYLGGDGGGADEGDSADGIAVDARGNTYVAGITYSTDFPVTSGAFQTVNKAAAKGNPQAFVTKLNPSGTALLYSTYLGGKKYDFANGIAVDRSGNAYVTGISASGNFPTTKGAFQTENNAKANKGTNAFVTKLSSDGTALEYSTYLGGSGAVAPGDSGSGIAVDAYGYAYITGTTGSKDFPLSKNAFQTVNNGGLSVFVTKLNCDGTALQYSTYLGGKKSDSGAGIAVDASAHAYVTGVTLSGDFPTTSGAFQVKNKAKGKKGGNAFVTKLNPGGTALIYSTYLGGHGDAAGGGDDVTADDDDDDTGDGDAGTGIALDARGNAYVTGYAFSADFPVTKGAFQTAIGAPLGDANAFVTKLSSDGTALQYSTYLGGNGGEAGVGDFGYSIAVNAAGNAFVTGFTQSSNFPVTGNAFQPINRAPDTTDDTGPNAFVTKLSIDGTALSYSTYLGGTTNDIGTGITLDAQGNAYVAGSANSTDFPVTRGAFQAVNNATNNGTSNAFVAKFSF